MRTRYSLLRVVIVVAVGICLWASVPTQNSLPVHAQEQCVDCPPQSEPDQGVLETGAHFKVNVNSNDFTLEQRDAIVQSFLNWQNDPLNYSGITFSFTYTTTPAFNDFEGAGTYAIQVNRGRLNEDTFAKIRVDNSWAMITLAPGTTDPKATMHSTSHEIGHAMGLGDCDRCCAGTSVMALGGLNPDGTTNYNDTTMGRAAPSVCDVKNSNERLGAELPEPDEGTGGDGDTRLRETTGETCWVRIFWECNWDYTNCKVIGYRPLGCW